MPNSVKTVQTIVNYWIWVTLNEQDKDWKVTMAARRVEVPGLHNRTPGRADSDCVARLSEP